MTTPPATGMAGIDPSSQHQPEVDLLLRGGLVVDGTSSPATRADVAVTGDRIVAVTRTEPVPARRTIDVTGLVVCPGFIDMHAHSDLRLFTEPEHLAKVAQGITTEVIGQDGLSYAPVSDATLAVLRTQLRGWNGDSGDIDWNWRTVGEYLDRLDQGITVNAAYLVPHGTVRMLVVGAEERPATAAEMAKMERVVAAGMAEGAVGLSAGLTYAPGMYAPDEELVALGRIAAAYGGFYAPHHRSYGAHALQAYGDCIAIAREAEVPLHLTHAHLGFARNRDRAPELLAMVDDALASGVEVTLDSYPYLAGATYLHALLPTWACDGGIDATVRRLRDTQQREAIRIEVEETGHAGSQGEPADWNIVVVTGVSQHRNQRYVGRSIAEAAQTEGRRPIDLFCELLADDQLGASCLMHIGNEENVRTIMSHPAHTGGTDGILVGDRPHPRGWGTFPRYLAHYVRELGLLRLEDAIRKFTSLPAARLGQWDRGLVRPGHIADLVAFDPQRVDDRATYEDPQRTPRGIDHVVVNGVPVIDGGVHTGARPGRALRRHR